MKTPFILAAAAALAIFSAGNAAAQSKIASVDMETLILSHPRDGKNKEELTALLRELEAQLAPKRKAAEALATAIEDNLKIAGNETLSEFTRRDAFTKAQKAENELRAKEKELREAAAAAQQQIARREHELFIAVLAEITDAIKAVAAAEKYDYVLDNSATRSGAPVPLVMFANTADDLTDKVVNALGGTRVDKKTVVETERKAAQ